jgi:hypothetical protein
VLGLSCGDLSFFIHLILFTMQDSKSECFDANPSSIVAGQPAKPFWENSSQQVDPIVEFCRKASLTNRFKRLAVYVKANGILVVYYRKNQVVSAFGSSLAEAVISLAAKAGI